MNRVSFDSRVTQAQIASWANDEDLEVLQTCQPVEERIWPLLNEELFSRRPDVQLRVYGFYGGDPCDLSFAKAMTYVERFAADCLVQATGFNALGAMLRLRDLSVGVFEAEDFGFLDDLAGGLEALALGHTSSKKPQIGAISRFRELKRLYLEGQQKGIEVVSDLIHLEDLTLRSISVDSLSFLVPLSQLWSLDIKLGGTRNLNALRSMTSIKYLELWQIQKFDNLSPIAEMTGLQNLFLQSLPNVRRLPDLSRATSLRRIVLDSMKGLESLSEAATAPCLEDFAQIAGPSLGLESYQALLDHPKLRRMLVSGSGPKKRAITERMIERGIKPIERLYAEEAFQYQ